MLEGILLKKKWLGGLGIFLLALAIRLIYLYQSADNPSFAAPVVDSGTYDVEAQATAAGQGLSHYFFWQPFFYPAFLSLVYYLSGSSIVFTKIIQALLGGISCLLTYQLGKTVFNRATGITAGGIMAVYGPVIFFESELLAAGWAVFWSLVLLLLFLRAESGGSLLLCFVLGICGALSIITHPTFLPFFAAATAWVIIIFYRQERQFFLPGLKLAAIAAGFTLVALPVAVTNLKVTGRFGILPAGGGINFFVGNNPDYVKTITARPGRGWAEIERLPGQDGVDGDLWEQQKYFNAKVVGFARTQPLPFVKGLGYKTVQFFSSREIPRNVDIYLFRQWSTLLGLLVWKTNGFGFPFGVLLPLTLLGVIGCWRQIPVALKLLLLFYPLSLILVFQAARYRLPVIPVMTVIAAAGLLNLINMIRRRSRPGLAMAGGVSLVAVLVAVLPGPFAQEQANFEAELYANVAGRELDRGQTDSAVRHLNTALSLQPDFPSARGNLGLALTRQGRFEEAVRHYNIALEQDDNSAEVHNNLAAAMVSINRPEQAIAHYVRAIEIWPGYAEARYNLGNLLLLLGRLEEAIEHLNRAVQLDKNFFQAHNSLAAALARKGEIEQAVQHFARAIELRPDEQQPRYNLAVTLAGCGRTREAIRELRELLKIPPPDPAVLDYLARLLIIGKDSSACDPGEAVALAAKACEITSYQQPDFLDTLARAHAAAGKFAEAAAVAEKALYITASAGSKEKSEYFQELVKKYRAAGDSHLQGERDQAVK